MVFKRMMQAMGVGGPSVETVLDQPELPSRRLSSRARSRSIGGDHAVDIEYVALGLVTRVEVESGDSEYNTDQEFHRQRLTGSFKLDAGRPARHPVPLRRAVGDPDHRGVRPAPARHDDGPAHRAGGGPRGRQERPGRGRRAPAAGPGADPRRACCGSASGSAGPTSSAAGSTACTRRCRSTRRSSSTRRRSTRAAINQLELTFVADPAQPAGGAGDRQARRALHRGPRRVRPLRRRLRAPSTRSTGPPSSTAGCSSPPSAAACSSETAPELQQTVPRAHVHALHEHVGPEPAGLHRARRARAAPRRTR